MEANQIIDNLLTMLVIPTMVCRGMNLSDAQDDVAKNDWVIDALVWLKNNGGARCDGNQEWVDRVASNPRNRRRTSQNRSAGKRKRGKAA